MGFQSRLCCVPSKEMKMKNKVGKQNRENNIIRINFIMISLTKMNESQIYYPQKMIYIKKYSRVQPNL